MLNPGRRQWRLKSARISRNCIELGQNLGRNAGFHFPGGGPVSEFFSPGVPGRLSAGSMDQDVGIEQDHFLTSR